MTGFAHVWLNSGVENDKLFLFNFEQRLRDNFGQKVNLELQATSRGTFYLLYNELFSKIIQIIWMLSRHSRIG